VYNFRTPVSGFFPGDSWYYTRHGRRTVQHRYEHHTALLHWYQNHTALLHWYQNHTALLV